MSAASHGGSGTARPAPKRAAARLEAVASGIGRTRLDPEPSSSRPGESRECASHECATARTRDALPGLARACSRPPANQATSEPGRKIVVSEIAPRDGDQHLDDRVVILLQRVLASLNQQLH